MIASINLPGQKIIMVEEYKSPNGKIFSLGLMLTIRSLELTIKRKHLKLLAVRNSKIINKLYGDIPEKQYVNKRIFYNGRESLSSVFYDLSYDDLQHFLENAKYKPAGDIFKMITELPTPFKK